MDTALKRLCMRDRIRDVLVARILDGTYPAGLQLKELSLAREFNVSQAPIREALRELEGTGLVTSERYRGTRVRGADSVEMRESYELRLMMETRSIERGLPLSVAMAEKLQSCITNMSDAVSRGDSEQYIDWALSFHRSLVEMGGNGTFLKLWDSLHWDVRGRIALRRLAAMGTGLAPVVAMHVRVMQALREGDARSAVEHLTSILQSVAAVFVTE
jgi:DNA-binding GntR family transcriptional regulator